MRGKAVKEVRGSFAFRVKMGEYDVEIKGTREEVLKTIEELPSLAASIYEAFEGLKTKKAAPLAVKKEAVEEEALAQRYPKILRTGRCDEAVLRTLETEWGKWRPRTVTELKEVLKVNEMGFSGRVLAGVLTGLVKRGKVRRWRTDAGYVYILAEKEALG